MGPFRGWSEMVARRKIKKRNKRDHHVALGFSPAKKQGKNGLKFEGKHDQLFLSGPFVETANHIPQEGPGSMALALMNSN